MVTVPWKCPWSGCVELCSIHSPNHENCGEWLKAMQRPCASSHESVRNAIIAIIKQPHMQGKQDILVDVPPPSLRWYGMYRGSG